MDLKCSLSTVLKTRKEYIEALQNLNINTVEDLLLYLPRAHEDLSQMQTIATSPIDTKVKSEER